MSRWFLLAFFVGVVIFVALLALLAGYCTPRQVLELRTELQRLVRRNKLDRNQTERLVQDALRLLEESRKLLGSRSTDAD